MNECCGKQNDPGEATDSRKGNKRSWAWAVLAGGASGGLMAACYWPLDLSLVAWIALVPWLLVLPRLSPGKTWLVGIILGLVFYRLSLDWVFDLYGPIGGGTVLLFSILMGFSFRVARLLMNRLGTAAMLWAVPVTFFAQEVVRSEGLPLFRFAYGAWGYSQAHFLWVAQIASLGGVYFLTFVLVAFNTAVAYGLIRKRLRAWIPAAAIAVAVAILAVISQPRSYDGQPKIPVACVQAETHDINVYRKLTTEAVTHPSDPAFVVLPEHTIGNFFSNDAEHPLVQSLAELARTHEASICIGAHSEPRPFSKCYYDNVGLLIGPEGEITLKQPKMVPVPFYTDGNPGRQQATADTPYGQAGVLICYDSSFTDVPRRLARLGAKLLLCPVYNAARWPVQQQWQQADMAVFRSIELRRCVVRAASSGVSMIVDATGEVQHRRTREQGRGILYGSIYALGQQTLFTRGGYYFAIIVTYLFLAIVVTLTLIQWVGYAAGIVRFLGRIIKK